MTTVPHTRYFRYRTLDGLRHSVRMKAFIQEQAIRLGVTQQSVVDLLRSGLTAEQVAGWDSDTPLPGAPENTAVPTITGTARVGTALTATAGTWAGTPTPTYAYQWQRGTTNISGATAATYTPVAADAGQTLRVVVTATNSTGSSSANSANTAAVQALPANTALPVISGTATVGETLTTTNGTWTGTPTPTYARQWKRDGANIASATATTYVLVEADEGATITVTVTGTNPVGNASATSAGTGPVAPAA